MKKLFYFFAILMALYSTSLFSAEVDTSKYITLKTAKEEKLSLNFVAPAPKTPIRIIHGDSTIVLEIDTAMLDSRFELTTTDSTVKIYGNIIGFDCSRNYITSLDIGNNTTISYLNCGYNKLISLDVSKNLSLQELMCSSNQLTSLDLSNSTQLTTLKCFNNQITSIDLSNSPKLIELDCDRNQLTSLDVSKNTELQILDCSSNQLTSLDIDNNTKLRSLDCGDNKLTSLDVSKNLDLTNLWCEENQLTSLDLSLNTQLMILYCYKNLFNTEAMNEIYCNLNEADYPGFQKNKAFCVPLYNKEDPNYTEIAAATSEIARQKKWYLHYGDYDLDERIPSNGDYRCNSDVDESLLSGISVFPNPATSKVQVQLDDSVNETLILVDLSGRAVLITDVVAGRANFDVSNLTAGTYFLRIGNRVQKLTVK